MTQATIITLLPAEVQQALDQHVRKELGDFGTLESVEYECREHCVVIEVRLNYTRKTQYCGEA